ncbi:MAG: class I SAM-dependent rRNA methyltransferase, partial [Proteobacteria bacterium]|nr:class I SAM-dependent rRNA methyltransferase [Pseudomonadota bacterium]
LRPERIVLRLSRNAALGFEQAGYHDGQNLWGDDTAPSVVFLEDGIRFWSDVVKGQKTGFFLDQRDNRRRIGQCSAGLEVLNAFSFSGGFSLHAARGGARSVTDLDISPHALEAARRNFELNAADPRLAAVRHESVQADAFAWLERSTEQFDIVICDPPSLAKRETERAGAIEAYHRLAVNSIARVRPGGLLLAASCSAHVTPEEFYAAVTEAAHRSGRRFGDEVYTALRAPHALIEEGLRLGSGLGSPGPGIRFRWRPSIALQKPESCRESPHRRLAVGGQTPMFGGSCDQDYRVVGAGESSRGSLQVFAWSRPARVSSRPSWAPPWTSGCTPSSSAPGVPARWLPPSPRSIRASTPAMPSSCWVGRPHR